MLEFVKTPQAVGRWLRDASSAMFPFRGHLKFGAPSQGVSPGYCMILRCVVRTASDVSWRTRADGAIGQ